MDNCLQELNYHRDLHVIYSQSNKYHRFGMLLSKVMLCYATLSSLLFSLVVDEYTPVATRGGNRLHRPTGAYDLVYERSDHIRLFLK